MVMLEIFLQNMRELIINIWCSQDKLGQKATKVDDAVSIDSCVKAGLKMKKLNLTAGLTLFVALGDRKKNVASIFI